MKHLTLIVTTMLAVAVTVPAQTSTTAPAAASTRPSAVSTATDATATTLPAHVRAEAVEFPGGAADVRLAGTLLLPTHAAKPVPGVVLVTGSGAQDRDESIMGRKPFKVLAEALAARGYAVLRYDDRGTQALKVGASTGDYSAATLKDFATDSGAALDYLAARSEVDAARVAICGHSTGGLEAAQLLGQGRVPGAAILLASPAVAGSKLLAQQTEDLLKVTQRSGEANLTDEQVAALSNAQSTLLDAYLSGDETRLKEAAQNAVRVGVAAKAPGIQVSDEMLAIGVKQATAQLQHPWMDHFLRYDPSADVQAAKVPVLALFGGRDLQVAPALNAEPMTAALTHAGSPHSLVAVLPTRNHLFQSATTGLPAEYATLTDEMGPDVTALIGNWLDRVFVQP